MKNTYTICYNPNIKNSVKVMEKLGELLNSYNLNFSVQNIDDLNSDCDFAFVVGGDGTILKACRFFSKSGITVLGINLGHLGFLSQSGIDELENTVNNIISNNFKTEQRLMLSCGCYNALNDFVIKGITSSRAVNFRLEIDDNYVCDYFADGIIISTPTGSTAYGMAAGGPVIYPVADVILIVPICPHSFSARPLVVPSNSKIKILSCNDQKYRVSADGQEFFEFENEILITKSNNSAKLALLNNNDFYSVLRNKLQWGSNPNCSE